VKYSQRNTVQLSKVFAAAVTVSCCQPCRTREGRYSQHDRLISCKPSHFSLSLHRHCADDGDSNRPASGFAVHLDAEGPFRSTRIVSRRTNAGADGADETALTGPFADRMIGARAADSEGLRLKRSALLCSDETDSETDTDPYDDIIILTNSS